MTKIVIKTTGCVSQQGAEQIADTVKEFLHDPDKDILIIPDRFTLTILGEEQIAELQETVDEIWIYKVKE
jgi:hypothetical protein